MSNMLKRSRTMVNGKTPTKKSATTTEVKKLVGGMVDKVSDVDSDASDVRKKFMEWNTLAKWKGELYADPRKCFSLFPKVMTWKEYEKLKVSLRCFKNSLKTVDSWNDIHKVQGKPHLETKWKDNYEVEVTPYEQMSEACREYGEWNRFLVEGIAVEDWMDIFEARNDKTITRLVFDKFFGLCDTVEVDKYGDMKTLSPCADCGIGTNGSQLCGKTHCCHLNCRFRRTVSARKEWQYERHCRSGKDVSFLPVIPLGFTCEVEISDIWYRVHHPKRESSADICSKNRGKKFFFKEIRCRNALQDWQYFVVEDTSLKSFIESGKMFAVERFSVSKDEWINCLTEIIDLTDDDDAQDQKLTKLPAPPSPSKAQEKPVPKTPSKAESKKRKAFETPEKDRGNVVQCPGAPQRKKTKVRSSVLQQMGKDITALQQKNKALEEKVAKLTNLVSELIGEKPEN